jgi:hypothetical protein
MLQSRNITRKPQAKWHNTNKITSSSKSIQPQLLRIYTLNNLSSSLFVHGAPLSPLQVTLARLLALSL